MNRNTNVFNNNRFGLCHLWGGEDRAYLSSALTQCTGDFFDTGFIKMTNECHGSVFVLRRAYTPG